MLSVERFFFCKEKPSNHASVKNAYKTIYKRINAYCTDVQYAYTFTL